VAYHATPPPLLVACKLPTVGDWVSQNVCDALVTVGHCEKVAFENPIRNATVTNLKKYFLTRVVILISIID
jgi:hypothetical protein